MPVSSNAPLLLNLGLVLVVCGWLLPGHYLPWDTFQQQWVCALGVMMVAADLLIGDAKPHRIRWPALSVLAVFIAVVPWLQWAVGKISFFSDALLPSLYLVAFALSFVVGATLNQTRGAEWRQGLCTAFVVGATLAQCIAVVQWLQLSGVGIFLVDVPPGGRPGGNLAQPNHHATLLALGIAAAIWGYETRTLVPSVVVLVSAWLGIGLVMTQSRTAWMFAAVLVCWWAVSRKRAMLRLTGLPLFLSIAVFALTLFGWQALNEAMLLSVEALGDVAVRGGARVRLTLWEVVWDAVMHAPWVGFGWNQVGIAQLRFGAEHPRVGEMALNSHNVLLDLWMWAGIPLGILVAVAVVAWFGREVRACHDGGRWALLLGCGAVWLHALLEYPLDYLYFLLPLALLMGTLDSTQERARISMARAWMTVPLTASIALAAWIGVEYLRVEEATKNVRLLLMGVGVDKVPHVPPPAVTLIDGPREFHRFMITPARPQMSAEELAWMQRVVERYPFPPAMLRYAFAAGLNGRHEEAAAVMRALCPMHSDARCAEGRAAWSEVQRQFPALASIAGP